VDFLLLVNSTYPSDKLVIHDSCAHCAQRIALHIDHGQLISATPPEPIVLQGGG
jgi:hypothetical protein